MEKHLSKKFNWICVPATKDHKKDRDKRGRLLAINKEIMNIKRDGYGEGILGCQIMYNKKRWRIVTVYSRNIKETFSISEEKEKEKLIICPLTQGRGGKEDR